MTNDLEQRIREKAYQLWELGGRLDGRADEYWFAASRELSAHAAVVPAQEGEIIVAAEPKTRRRAAKPAAVTAAAAAPRRRRSSTPVLSS